MAAALSSSLWYALAETQKCPSSALSPVWLFFLEHPYLLLCSHFHPHPSQTKPVNPQTSQVRITQPLSKRPVLLGVPPELCTSSHTDFERAEVQQVGALSITANENEQAY